MSTPIGADLHRQTTGGGGPVANNKHHQILIVGGGTAGVTVAASLRRRGPRSLDIAVVEPSETHYYQPCFTLVGAGAYDMAKTQRPERNLIPAGVTLIHGAAKAFDPDKNSVMLETGDALTYDYLVVYARHEAGLGQDRGLVCEPGQERRVQQLFPNIRALHLAVRPGTEIRQSCSVHAAATPVQMQGAPQKIVYLTADRLRRAGTLQACDLQ